MSLTTCRDCQGKITFVGGQPYDYTWHSCPGCGYGSAIPTLLHYRNTQHIAAVKARAKKPAPVRKDREIKPEPVYIGKQLVTDPELLALIAQAERMR